MFIYRIRLDCPIYQICIHGSTFTIFYDPEQHARINAFITDFEKNKKHQCSIIVRGEGVYHDYMTHGKSYDNDAKADSFFQRSSKRKHVHCDFEHFVTAANMREFFDAFRKSFRGALTDQEVTTLVAAFRTYENSLSQMQDMIHQYKTGITSILNDDPYVYKKCPVTQKHSGQIMAQLQQADDQAKKQEQTEEYKNVNGHVQTLDELETVLKENKDESKQDSSSKRARLNRIKTLCEQGLRYPDATPSAGFLMLCKTTEASQIKREIASVVRFETFHELEKIFLDKTNLLLAALNSEKKADAKLSTSTAVLISLGGPGPGYLEQKKSEMSNAPPVPHAPSPLHRAKRQNAAESHESEQKKEGCLEICAVM